jgi:hypothetical protein
MLYIGQPAYDSGIKPARRSMCEKPLRHVDTRKAQQKVKGIKSTLTERGRSHCL